MEKRIWYLILCALFLSALVPAPALGADAGDFVVTGGTLGVDFTYNAGDGALQFVQPGNYTVSMKNPGTTSSGKIQIVAGTEADPVNLTLDNVGIINGYCAFDLGTSSYVNLTLEGSSNRLISGNLYPGIRCRPGTSISIGGSGMLYAQGGNQGAGIGGGNIGSNTNSGTITITSGKVVATGGIEAAGIGGAFGGTAGTVTISGGTVIATGGSRGSGIGGGDSAIGSPGNGGTVYISGGSVNATGTGGGEAIGKGDGGSSSGTLTDGPGGADVYLTTVTLDGVGPGTAIHSLTTGGSYGTDGMQTDTDGKLYLYLPENTHTTTAQTTDGGSPATIRDYAGDIETGNSGTLSLVFHAVTSITGVPTTATARTDLTLTGTVEPANATNRTITWSVVSQGTTGASITGNTLSTTGTGTATVRATIANGATASTDYTEDFTITVGTAPVDSGKKDDGRGHTLTNAATGLTVSGPGIRGGTKLIIQPLFLDEPGQSAGSDAIRQYILDNDLTVLFGADLSLSRSFSGGLTITIPVGTQYDGQTLTLLHYHDGVLETLTATVVNGQAVFTVSGLSPVALVADTAAIANAANTEQALDTIPITGDSGSTIIWWLLCGVSAAGIAAMLLGRRKRNVSRQ